MLHKDQVLVGSDLTNDLVISDGTVSRHHASITRREGRYELADLNSTNGTFVNGQRLTGSTWIDKGYQVRFGEDSSFQPQGLRLLQRSGSLPVLRNYGRSC